MSKAENMRVIATNNFVFDYIESAKRCCDSCYRKALENQAWIARAFESGWEMHEIHLAEGDLRSSRESKKDGE